MAGINLSQSVVEKQVQEPVNKNRGIGMMLGLFVLTLLVWGGVAAGEAYYTKQAEARNALMESKKLELSGPGVSAVADAAARLSLVDAGVASRIHPQAILTALESAILPSIRLEEFTYEDATGMVQITGIAPGYKEVAQQIMALKTSARFSSTEVVSLGHEEGSTGVSFSIESHWAEKQ